MDEEVKEIAAGYAELDKKLNAEWDALSASEGAAWDRFKGLTTKQMLKATLDHLSSPEAVKELWKNATPADAEGLENLNVKFNLKSGEISLHSDKKAEDGKDPLFEWTMDTKTGEIEETTRTDNKERTVEKQVDPATLRLADDFPKIELKKKSEEPVTTESSQ